MSDSSPMPLPRRRHLARHLACALWVCTWALAIVLVPRVGWAEECGILPGDPERIELSTEVDEDRALELYDKAYLAYSEGNCHCTAWYNLQAYEMQPTPVLMTNIAAALERCDDLDAARRYARKTLALEAADREREDAQALIERVDQTLASTEYANVTLDAYEAEALTVGHVSWVRGDNPTLRRGSYDVQITRSGNKGAIERIEVPPAAVDAGCQSDADCAAGLRCELATGQCIAAEDDDGEGLDPMLVAGAATATVGVALLVTGMVVDLSMTSEVSLYESFQDNHAGCFDGDTASACDATEDEISDYNDRGSSLETLRAAALGTYISGALLAAGGTGLLIYALVSDSGSESDAGAWLDWTVAPLVGDRSVDGGWLSLRARF